MSKSKILSNYKKAIFDELRDAISTGSSNYYAFAANPVAHNGLIPDATGDDYSNQFINNWTMLFGKKISFTDIIPVIKNNMWTQNKVYDFYDDRNPDVLTRNNFYVISAPQTVGGYYNIYKCLDNAGGLPSTRDPGSTSNPTQTSPFIIPEDKYKWVYITSVSQAEFTKFGTNEFFPVAANGAVVLAASNNGISKVVIANGGTGYKTYANGIVKSIARTGTVLQLDDQASKDTNFYKNNSIYITNESTIGSQLKVISDHYTNSTGTWCKLDSALNVSLIVPNITKYYISPRVLFDTDGQTDPIAYTIIEPVANSISKIVLLDPGSKISRANVSIQSNTLYGTGASVYAVVPPPGGHGSNPASELNMLGMSISFNFSSTESNQIVASNILYNKIGIVKNPYALNQLDYTKSETLYTANAFNQVIKANVYPNYVFTAGEIIKGTTSGAMARVLFSNSSQVYLVGDRNFQEGEAIVSSANIPINIQIKTKPSVYAKDLNPLYVQNINNVSRAKEQVETFKLIIQV